MGVSVEEYQRLRRIYDEAKAEASRAEGVLQEQYRLLKEDFGCDSVEQAETLLKRLREDEQKAAESYRAAFDEFECKWKDKLEEFSDGKRSQHSA